MPAGAAGAAGAGGASSRASSAGATAAAAAPVTLSRVAREMTTLVIVGPRDVAKHEYVHHSALTDLLGSLIAGRWLRQLCQRVNNSKLLRGDAKADETTVIAAYENMMRNQFPLQKAVCLARRRKSVLEVRDEQ